MPNLPRSVKTFATVWRLHNSKFFENVKREKMKEMFKRFIELVNLPENILASTKNDK